MKLQEYFLCAKSVSATIHESTKMCEPGSKTDTEEKKLLNKVIILVFFVHKKYSRSFVKLWFNHRCHMDYFNDALTSFLCLDCGSSLAVYGESESSLISLNIS